MVTRSPRSRSTASTATAASVRARPMSRQSTTSLHSNVTQTIPSQPPELQYQTATEMPSTVWQQHQRGVAPAPSNQLGNPDNHFVVDASLHHHAPMSFSPDVSFQNDAAIQMELAHHFDQMEGRDNSAFDMSMDGTLQEDPTADSRKRKKGSASSQANDNELRRLFRENQGRDLHDVALQVLKDEKGPKSEKTKQIFGMLWLSTHTTRSNSSVPRNRVFSSYATRCGTERVPPLNPASFGKLVRIIFPGITTRRLGVRGESKYHYVELSLIDDSRPDRASVPRARSSTVEAFSNQQEAPKAKEIAYTPQLTTDAEYFSPSDSPRLDSQHPRPDASIGSLYLQIADLSEQRVRDPKSIIIRRPLQFPSRNSTQMQGDVQLELPSIEPYLPPGTDVDAVDSLTSVYRSHCLLAIDNFRFCKTEKLSDSYKSLVGLLTVPGQKLLAHPKISAWIRECDWMKYQKMIPMLDMIILTQVPRKAMAHMEFVALHICNWISQFFQNQPQHTQDAMLGPANIFVSLLERFLRVNRAALDVATVLENVETRDQLWHDWVAHVRPLHVLQNSLLQHGHTRVLHILTQEVRFLLSPLEAGVLVSGDPLFDNNGVQSEFQMLEAQLGSNGSSSSIIARLSRFLGGIASRFPGLDARSLLSHIDVIGSNISRNMTLNGASSLGNWWRIKLFIDEMSHWLAEKGGFLETDSSILDPTPPVWQPNYNTLAIAGSNMNRAASHISGLQSNVAGRSAAANSSHAQARSNSQPTMNRVHSQAAASRGASIAKQDEAENLPSRGGSTVVEDDDLGGMNDDSGIGMGLDDEFGIDTKYNNFVQGVHGSDPADVVVC